MRCAVLLAAMLTSPVAADCVDAGPHVTTTAEPTVAAPAADQHGCPLIDHAELLPEDLVVDVRSDALGPRLPGVVQASFAQLAAPPLSSAPRVVLAGSGADDPRIAAECGALAPASRRMVVLRSGMRALAAESDRVALGRIQPAVAAALDREGIVDLAIVEGESSGGQRAAGEAASNALRSARRSGRPLVIGVSERMDAAVIDALGRDALANDVYWIEGGARAYRDHMTRFAEVARSATTRTAPPCFVRR